MDEPLTVWRELLAERVLPRLGEPIRESPVLEARLPDLIRSVKAHGLEGLVAKRRHRRYEPGQRSGAWQKMRVNQSQALVIAGYTVSARNFDANIFGYYSGGNLLYAGRTRSGFPAVGGLHDSVAKTAPAIGNAAAAKRECGTTSRHDVMPFLLDTADPNLLRR